MGSTKSQIFSTEQNQIADFAKAIAHPARVAIIHQLLKLNACICGDLVEEIGLSQSTVSQHLKELKHAGIIKGKIDGPKVCYCLDYDVCRTAISFFTNLLSNPGKNDCC